MMIRNSFSDGDDKTMSKNQNEFCFIGIQGVTDWLILLGLYTISFLEKLELTCRGEQRYACTIWVSSFLV